MKVKFGKTRNSVLIEASYSNAKESVLRDSLYKQVLARILNNKAINLVTISPQDYSFGYEVSPHYLKTIGRESFLINVIASCDIGLIENIIVSEEFRRTLLIILKNDSLLSDEQLSRIIRVIKTESVDLLEEIVFCDDDGESLLVYNNNITLKELNTIVKLLELENNVKIDINVS